MIKIRRATKKDIPKIGDLIKEEFNKPPYLDGWTDNSVKRTLENYFKIGYGFIAFAKGEIIGAVIIRDDPYAKGLYLAIEELVVKKEFQKQGIGKGLIEAVEKVAKSKKAHSVYLYTHRKSGAFKFYKKLGYKESKNMATLGKKLK